MKGGGVFTLRSFHTSSLPAPDLNSFTCPNCNNKVGKERTYEVKYKQILPTFKGTEGVPRIFLEYYPKISVADYKLIKNDAQFLERKARVCDTCYIDFTQVHQNGSRPKVRTSTSPTLARSSSSSGSAAVPTSPTLSRSDSTAKYSSASNSPPSSPLFSKATPLFKSSPPPTKKSPNSTLNNNNTSPNGTITPSSLSPPPSSSAKRSTLKNGTHKESYYLNLYEELDNLRRELNHLKSNEESSLDELNQQLKEKDDELKSQKKAYATKSRQDNQQKDEQIKELQTTINNLQQEHAATLASMERESNNKLETKTTAYETEKNKLQSTIQQLRKEIEQVKIQSEQRITTDRSEVLAEVEKVKQKFDMEKAVEKEQLRTKFREDLEITRKKNEEKNAILRQQIIDLENALAQERKEKEKAMEEKKEVERQMELLKARSRVS